LLSGPKLSDLLGPLRSRAIWLSLLCAIFVVAGAAWIIERSDAAKSRPAAPAAYSPAACSAPNPSFCPVQSQYSRYVASGDYADILERQIATPVNCARRPAPAGVCIGTTGVVATFAAQRGSAPLLFTRNQFINYFNTFSTESGPFAFKESSGNSTHITMMFASSRAGTTMSIPFVLKGGQWQAQPLQIN
jgi:hypothetical protein